MKHIRKFESYRNNKRKDEIIKESVLQVNDIYKVRTMIDLPQSLINAYVKKVKDVTGKNVRQFFGDVDIAEEIVKYINTNFLNVDQIPAGALTGDAQGAQPGMPGQAQMGAQPGQPDMTQGPAQSQGQVAPQGQAQPGSAQPGSAQQPVQGQVQGQAQPAQGQVQGQAQQPVQGQAQPGAQNGQVQVQTQAEGGQTQGEEDFEEVKDEEEENEEELPI